jgi:hypothetical protein
LAGFLLNRQDWRWLQRRADTPWYPSVRLFRQPEMGQWNPVFDEVRRVLQAGWAHYGHGLPVPPCSIPRLG